MCGIFFVKHQSLKGEELLKLVKPISKLQTHRGPDESDYLVLNKNVALCHERLAVIDLKTGKQPFQNEDKTIGIIVNGENYNHLKLRKEDLKQKHTFASTSDSEIILHMYEETKTEEDEIALLNKIDGVFAFVLYDTKKDRIFAARDPVGVKPLYYGRTKDGSMWLSSEMKCLQGAKCETIEIFPPGYFLNSKGKVVPWYKPKWYDTTYYKGMKDLDLKVLREKFETAVEKRLMSDVPLGVFLSGGLDSSLVASVVSKLLKKKNKNAVLHSFSVGINKNSPDLIAARKVAKYLGTVHHEKIFSFEEGLKMLEQVIWQIETFDVTSIRSSTPMLMLSKLAKKYITVVLSGEGSDEMFGGYIYFCDAKSPQHLQTELVSKVRNLHTSDVNRCDKATMGAALEARVPFLDKDFLDYVMTIHPKHKIFKKGKDGVIEKLILRNAFKGDYLPHEILFRVKEQFSDGVGYSWIDTLKSHCNKVVTDKQMKEAKKKFPYITPITKEAYYYRTIFHKLYPNKAACKTSKFGRIHKPVIESR